MNFFSVFSHGAGLLSKFTSKAQSHPTHRNAALEHPCCASTVPSTRASSKSYPTQYGTTQAGRRVVHSAATRAALPLEQQQPLVSSTEPFHPHPQCCTSLSKHCSKHLLHFCLVLHTDGSPKLKSQNENQTPTSESYTG